MIITQCNMLSVQIVKSCFHHFTIWIDNMISICDKLCAIRITIWTIKIKGHNSQLASTYAGGRGGNIGHDSRTQHDTTQN